jgi:hypothetical protein
MNRRQKFAMWAGIALTVAMGLYPPWVKEYQAETFHIPAGSEGYAWIFSSPSTLAPDSSVGIVAHLDISRLLVQSVLLWIVFGPLIWSFRGIRAPDPPATAVPRTPSTGPEPTRRFGPAPAVPTAPAASEDWANRPGFLANFLRAVMIEELERGGTITQHQTLLTLVLRDESKVEDRYRFERDQIGRKGLAEPTVLDLIQRAVEGFTTAPPAAMTRRQPTSRPYRQPLLRAVGYDEDKVDRLIALEETRTPGATDEQLHSAGYERWLRDNR